MKIEPRGKYAGVKVHLDEGEVRALLVKGNTVGGQPIPTDPVQHTFYRFGQKLSRKIHALMVEEPEVLTPRTPEQIRAELELELKKATEKLAKMDKGEVWNEDSTSKQ